MIYVTWKQFTDRLVLLPATELSYFQQILPLLAFFGLNCIFHRRGKNCWSFNFWPVVEAQKHVFLKLLTCVWLRHLVRVQMRQLIVFISSLILISWVFHFVDNIKFLFWTLNKRRILTSWIHFLRSSVDLVLSGIKKASITKRTLHGVTFSFCWKFIDAYL